MKGGTTQACAACKYQRRRCEPTCPLAPYFPADQPKMFQNAHRLFGVSNILKTLKGLKTKDLQDEAMRSIIYESDMRKKYPVHGCTIMLSHLTLQLKRSEEELFYVNSYLAGLRSKEQFQIGFGSTSGPNFDPNNVMSQYYHSNDNMDGYQNLNGGVDIGESSEVKPLLWMQQQQQLQQLQLQKQQQQQHSNNNEYMMNYLTINDASVVDVKPSMSPQGLPSFHQEIEISNDYDDTPYDTFQDDVPDDQQSYIESKDLLESSAESKLKNTMQNTDTIRCQSYELKGAASCFSLANFS